MLPLALSTCWNSYRHQDGYAMLREIRQLGFPVCELGHAIRFSLWPGILKAYEEDLIKIQTLHNYCPVPTSIFRPDPNCYEFSDARPNMRALAVKASQDTIRHAAKFGAKAVVFHLGSAGPYGISRKLKTIYDKGGFLTRPYTEVKVEAVKKRKEAFKVVWPRVKECLKPLVDLGGELKMKLGFEIREDFEEFPHEEEFTGGARHAFPADVVGYWHDFGHSQRKEFFGWHDHFETLSPARLQPHVRLRTFMIAAVHRKTICRSATARSPSASLLPLLPENAIGVLELACPVRRRSKSSPVATLWNSYVAASG